MDVSLDCSNRQITMKVQHSFSFDFACHSPGIKKSVRLGATPDAHANNVTMSVATAGARFRVNDRFDQCPFETAEVDLILLLVDSFLNLQDVILCSFGPPFSGRG